MNILDFMNSPDENERKIFEHMIQTLTGQNPPPLVKRAVLVMSTLSDDADNKAALAQTFNVPLHLLAHVDIQKGIREAKANWAAVKQVVEPYKCLLKADKKTRVDKYEELYDLGRFIVATDNKFTIATDRYPLKYPDFVLLHNDGEMGVEHTRLMDASAKETLAIAKSYLATAEQLLLANTTGLTGIINVSFNYQLPVIDNHTLSSRKMSKDQKAKIPVLIADYLQSYLSGGNAPKPMFIDQVDIYENPEPQLSLVFAENYYTKQGFEEALMKRIQEKEKRYEAYISEAQVKHCWLLITIDGYSSFSGYDVKTVTIPAISTSYFEKILLFEVFSSKIIEVYNR